MSVETWQNKMCADGLRILNDMTDRSVFHIESSLTKEHIVDVIMAHADGCDTCLMAMARLGLEKEVPSDKPSA